MLLAHWVSVAIHAHTFHSPDSALTAGALAEMAQRHGIEAVAITDHNSVQVVKDPDFQATGSVTLIPGEEWGSFRGSLFYGHVSLIGLDGDTDVDPHQPLEGMFAEAKRRHALAFVNHPFNWALFWRGGEIPLAADGVEVWNQDWGNLAMGNPNALTWWDAALRNGRRLVAIGGVDIHGFRVRGEWWSPQRIDAPVTRVWAEDASVEAIRAGLAAGRVQIAREVTAPLLDLHVGGAAIGDEIAEARDSATSDIVVAGGKGLTVSLHTRAGLVARHPLAADDATLSLRVPIDSRGDFVRAELRGTGWPEAPLIVMTNPIYFKRRPG